MLTIVAGSLAFSIGGAFMHTSAGFTRLWPSVLVAACFVVGAAFVARAVQVGGLSTTYVVGLGVEAIISVAIGLIILGERLTTTQMAGLLIIGIGLLTVRQG
jgi:small multidrug resistance pump